MAISASKQLQAASCGPYSHGKALRLVQKEQLRTAYEVKKAGIFGNIWPLLQYGFPSNHTAS